MIIIIIIIIIIICSDVRRYPAVNDDCDKFRVFVCLLCTIVISIIISTTITSIICNTMCTIKHIVCASSLFV